jgi:hypothetical protein
MAWAIFSHPRKSLRLFPPSSPSWCIEELTGKMNQKKDERPLALYTLAFTILINTVAFSYYMGTLSERVANLTQVVGDRASKEAVEAVSRRVDRNTLRIDGYHGGP